MSKYVFPLYHHICRPPGSTPYYTMKINILTKLNPNEILRNWSKEHSLYILGLKRKTFYIVAASVGTFILALTVGMILGIQAVIAKVRQDAEDVTGIIVEVAIVVTRDDGVVTTVVGRSTSILDEEVRYVL